jgi:hypothetical protein
LTQTTTTPEPTANASPTPAVSSDELLDLAFEDLMKELEAERSLTPLQRSSLRDALRQVVYGQATLLDRGPGSDVSPHVRRTMRSAMNTIELIAEAKAFNAATTTRRYAWAVFDRLLVAGIGAL